MWKILIGLLFLSELVHAKVYEYDDLNYYHHLDKGIPTILYLYAPWCDYCSKFTPIFAEIAQEYEDLGDRIQFVKIDVEKNLKASKEFRVEYLPTLRFVNNKKNTLIKSRGKAAVKEFIKEQLNVVPVIKEEPEIVDGIVIRQKKFHIKQMDPADVLRKMPNKNMIIVFANEADPDYFDLVRVSDELERYYARNKFVRVAVVNKTIREFPEELRNKFAFTLNDNEAEAFISLPHFENPIAVNGSYTFVNMFNQFNLRIKETETEWEKLGIIAGVDFSVYPDLCEIKTQAMASHSEFTPLYTEILDIAINDEDFKFERMYKFMETELIQANLTYNEFLTTMAKVNIARKLSIQEDILQKMKDKELAEIGELVENLELDLNVLL